MYFYDEWYPSGTQSSTLKDQNMLIHMDGPAGVHYKQSEREVITPLCSTCVITVNQLYIKRFSSTTTTIIIIIIIIMRYNIMELLHHSKTESTVSCITDYNKFMHRLRTILVSKQAANLQVCLKKKWQGGGGGGGHF